MSKFDNIFIIGPMGVGKTTIGRRLARRLDKQFIDSDRELEKRTGATISLIFDVEGETGFRERETRLLDELTAGKDLVLATGGGAVLSEANRRRLKERGIVVYLYASPELLMKRTAHDQTRPLLNTGDRLGKILALLEERGPLYRETADLSLDIDELSVNDAINRLMEQVNSACSN